MPPLMVVTVRTAAPLTTTPAPAHTAFRKPLTELTAAQPAPPPTTPIPARLRAPLPHRLHMESRASDRRTTLTQEAMVQPIRGRAQRRNGEVPMSPKETNLPPRSTTRPRKAP